MPLLKMRPSIQTAISSEFKGSRIKNSKLTTPNIVNIFDTDLTDSQLESTKHHIHAENIQVHGKVELVAKTGPKNCYFPKKKNKEST